MTSSRAGTETSGSDMRPSVLIYPAPIGSCFHSSSCWIGTCSCDPHAVHFVGRPGTAPHPLQTIGTLDAANSWPPHALRCVLCGDPPALCSAPHGAPGGPAAPARPATAGSAASGPGSGDLHLRHLPRCLRSGRQDPCMLLREAAREPDSSHARSRDRISWRVSMKRVTFPRSNETISLRTQTHVVRPCGASK